MCHPGKLRPIIGEVGNFVYGTSRRVATWLDRPESHPLVVATISPEYGLLSGLPHLVVVLSMAHVPAGNAAMHAWL